VYPGRILPTFQGFLMPLPTRSPGGVASKHLGNIGEGMRRGGEGMARSEDGYRSR
jgi:hypothetical protein